VPTQATGMAGAHLNKPHLRVRPPSQESVGSGQFVMVDLVITRLDVDDDVFPLVLCAQRRTNLTLVDAVASLGELLLGVSGMNC